MMSSTPAEPPTENNFEEAKDGELPRLTAGRVTILGLQLSQIGM
jgi:hypothetical protein